MQLEIGGIPDGHIVSGHIAYLKVIDEKGESYWAMRSEGINDMEALGMATDQQQEYARDIMKGRRLLSEEDE